MPREARDALAQRQGPARLVALPAAGHEKARSNDGLKLDGGSLHWVAGTHRCFKGSDPLDSNNNKFTLSAKHYILSKCGYFNNYYIRSGNETVSIKATEKLDDKIVETDMDKSSNSFVTPFQVSVNLATED